MKRVSIACHDISWSDVLSWCLIVYCHIWNFDTMWHQKDITHPMRHRHTGHRDHKIQDLLNTMRHYETSYDHIRDHTTFEIPNTWNLNALWCLMMLHGLSICNNLCIKQCSYIRVTTVVSSCFFSPGIWKCPLSRMLMASCKHAWLYTHAKPCVF